MRIEPCKQIKCKHHCILKDAIDHYEIRVLLGRCLLCRWFEAPDLYEPKRDEVGE